MNPHAVLIDPTWMSNAESECKLMHIAARIRPRPSAASVSRLASVASVTPTIDGVQFQLQLTKERSHDELDAQARDQSEAAFRAFKARVVECCHEFVQAAGAMPSARAILSASRYLAPDNGLIAQAHARADAAAAGEEAPSSTAVVAPFAVEVYRTPDGRMYSAYSLSAMRDSIAADDVAVHLGEWLAAQPELPEVVFVPMAEHQEHATPLFPFPFHHAMLLVVYPRIRAVTLFDSEAIGNEVELHTCSALHAAMYGLNIRDYKAAVMVDPWRRNADGSPLTHMLQQEMEREVKGELGVALLSEEGFCTTWSRLAMYLCMRTGVYHPRLVMGMLQHVMREHPAFMVATLAGAVVRGVHYVEQNHTAGERDAVRERRDKAIAEARDKAGVSWSMTPAAVAKLKIDEERARAEYGELLAEYM
jgi:hypothetical protein